jgi:murein DD-endopeptidase MepM/ murein hydrolase activator NlpD
MTESSRPAANIAAGAVIAVERFEYAPADLLLRLSVRLAVELPSPARPLLFVERAAIEHAYPPLLACTGRAPLKDPEEWLWRGAFAVPPDLASDPGALFAVRLCDEVLLALPAPSGRVAQIPELSQGDAGSRTWPYSLRRGALLFVVTCQLSAVPAWSPAGALADGSSGASPSGEPAAEPPAAPAGDPTEPAPEAPPALPGDPTEPAPETPPAPQGDPTEPVPETPSAPSAGGPVGPASESPSAPLGSAQGGSATGETHPSFGSASSAAAHAGSPESAAKIAPAGRSDRDRSAHGAPRRPRHHAGHDRRDVDATAQGPAVSETSPVPDYSEIPPVLSGFPPGLGAVGEDGPPAYLIPIYVEAGRRYDVPWRVLAAINAIESDYGRNLAVSSAGAVGWMQFMPDTWRQWAVDADHDGQLDPYSPHDAIFTAARYLQASGASRDLRGAIFAYNHADWYVTEVLLRAQMLGSAASFAPVVKGYSLPLDAQYMQQLGRTDDGVDIETAPDGALVYSITPGVVSAVASNPAGFGPNYPVIEATGGSLAGQHIYYGHVAEALVQPGQRVSAGQPVAIVGHTGDAVSLGHGHIEIGFSDANGDPLSHHGAAAWTPAGDAMRSFLVTLSAVFGVHNS